MATITYQYPGGKVGVVLADDGTVEGRIGDSISRWRLTATEGPEILEAVTLALADTSFPEPPTPAPPPDGQAVEVVVTAGATSQVARIAIPVAPVHAGWAELQRLLSALLWQATGGTLGGPDVLPPCLERKG